MSAHDILRDFVQKEQNSSPALYLELQKEFAFTKNFNGKDYQATEPCFTYFDKDEGVEKYASQSISGKLFKLSVGEKKRMRKKDNKPFTVKELFLEFHSSTSGARKRTVVTVNYDSKFAETLLAKLYGLNSPEQVEIKVGRFTPKDKPDQNIEFLTVKELDVATNTQINLKPKIVVDRGNPAPEDAFVIPKVVYYKKTKEGALVQTTDYNEAAVDANGYKLVDDDWKSEKKLAYETATAMIAKHIDDYHSQQPAFAQEPKEDEVEPVGLTDEDISGHFTLDDDEPSKEEYDQALK